MASSSLAALLIGGGAPQAFAACAINDVGNSLGAGPFNNTTNSINCINIQGSTVNGGTGNVSNTSPGVVATTAANVPIGIAIDGSTLTGAVINTGAINASSGTVQATGTGKAIVVINNALVTNGVTNSGSIFASTGISAEFDATFQGGITNSGTISGSAEGLVGITVVEVSAFSGGITNGGTITGDAFGISFNEISTFSGGITNGGTISDAGNSGIAISGVSIFSNGITNSGVISAGGGIQVNDGNIASGTFSGGITNGGAITAGNFGIEAVTIASFSGGITNSGGHSITATGIGIAVSGVSAFTGNIVNSGKINAGTYGIVAASVSTFTGGVSNAGTISAGLAAIQIGIHTTNVLQPVTLTGTISNSGVIVAATGINVTSSTINGSIVESGTLLATNLGIAVDSASQVSSGVVGIAVSGKTLTGGISVGGSVSGTRTGVGLAALTSFGGGITNSGTISGAQGIALTVSGGHGVSTFSGGINNTGTITGSGGNGIQAVLVQTFLNGITNSGLIGGSQFGIGLGNGFGSIKLFSGEISNSTGGTISGGISGIVISAISTFSEGINNAGKIAGVAGGLRVGSSSVVHFGVNNAGGGIVNSGTISATTGVGVFLTPSTFFGGVTNSAGLISGGRTGMFVAGEALFSGGIVNNATMSGGINGVVLGAISSFGGGLTNTGTLSGTAGIGLKVGYVTTVFHTVLGVSTFSGNISNSGIITGATGIQVNAAVTFAAGGAIINSGNITGTGGTAIDVSLATSPMTINQTAGTITGAIKLSSNADVLNISGGAISGNIVGQGTHDAISFALGSGAFTYANDFTGINQVQINSGTVILNGTDSAESIVVNGGTLAGTGTLDPLAVTIASGATLSPGTPGVPGTSMAIIGNLAFASGAAYQVYINPATASSAIVTGSASLAGYVDAVFSPGRYVQKQYTILTATGGLGGTTFSGLVNSSLPPGTTDTLSYDADDVFLNLMPGFTQYGGLNLNQQNVATTLGNFFNTTGGIPASFFGLTPTQLTQVDGELATDAERGVFQLSDEFLTLMLDPFVTGRSAPGSGAMGFAPDQQGNFPPDVAMAYAGVLKAPPKQSFDRRWTTWGAAFGGSATANGNPVIGSTNVNTSAYAFAAGMDYHYSSDSVVGFALAGGGTNWGLQQNLGTGRSDALQAGLYGIRYLGPIYLAGALDFTNGWFKTNRIAMGDDLSASFAGQSYGARVEAGYRYMWQPAVAVTPYAALQATTFHTPAYSETDLTGGGFGLSYNAMNGTDTRSELGGRTDDLTAIGGMPLLLRAKLAWAHDWVSNPALNASFESLPGTSFTVFGAAIPRNSALTSAGAELFLTPHWSFIGKFDGEFASSSQTYAGSGTFRYTW